MKLPSEVYIAVVMSISAAKEETSRLIAISQRLEDVEAEREFTKQLNCLEEGHKLLSAEQYKFS